MTKELRYLLIDDDHAFCRIVARSLERSGAVVMVAHDAKAALAAAARSPPERILLDLRLGADNGLQLIADLLIASPACRIVLATGFASIATAVEAMRRGAFNYLPKPFDIATLLSAFEVNGKSSQTVPVPAAPPTLRRQGWEHLQRVLTESGGNISAAARVLGIDRRTLQRRLAKRPARERS